mgnify:CR=1 FL=1
MAQINHRILAIFPFISVLFWSLAFIAIKICLQHFDALNLTIARLFLGCSLFLLLLLVSKQKKLPTKHEIPHFMLLGLFGLIAYHLGLNYGEQFINANTASLIIATSPLFIAIAAHFRLDEHLSLANIIGIIIALIGVIVISIYGQPNSSIQIDYLLGAFAVLIASISGAIYTIYGKKLMKKYDPTQLTCYSFLFGSIFLLPLLSQQSLIQFSTIPQDILPALIFLGIFPTFISYLLWYKALQSLKASTMGPVIYLIPLLSTTFSYFFLGEHVTPLFLIGGVLIIGGIILVNKKTQQRSKISSD